LHLNKRRERGKLREVKRRRSDGARQTAEPERTFRGGDDPRLERTREHELLDMLVIAICAVICGADDWGDKEGWGNEKIVTMLLKPTTVNGVK
jgi:hypothetical protein